MSTDDVKNLRAELRAHRAEMKAAGVRKTSPFNGGMDRTAYSMNARRFELETRLAEAVKKAATNGP